MRSLLCIALFGIALIPVLWLRADEPSSRTDRPAAVPSRPRTDRQSTNSRQVPPSRFRHGTPAPLPADLKSVELEFVVLDEHALAVVVAGGAFSASADLASAGGEMHIRIDGDARQLGSADSWLLSFDATMHRNDLENDNDSTFTAAGSAVVELNSKVTLARLPGPDLAVTLRPVREQPAD